MEAMLFSIWMSVRFLMMYIMSLMSVMFRVMYMYIFLDMNDFIVW